MSRSIYFSTLSLSNGRGFHKALSSEEGGIVSRRLGCLDAWRHPFREQCAGVGKHVIHLNPTPIHLRTETASHRYAGSSLGHGFGSKYPRPIPSESALVYEWGKHCSCRKSLTYPVSFEPDFAFRVLLNYPMDLICLLPTLPQSLTAEIMIVL